MITTILFLISAALAIPTFGISLVLFFVAKSWWDRLTADAIAKHAYLSFKNGSASYDLYRVNGAGIRRFYNSLGTKVPRYTFEATGKGCYCGVVDLPGAGELAVFVVRMNQHVTIYAVREPEITVGGLMDGSFVKGLIDSYAQALDRNGPQAISSTDDGALHSQHGESASSSLPLEVTQALGAETHRSAEEAEARHRKWHSDLEFQRQLEERIQARLSADPPDEDGNSVAGRQFMPAALQSKYLQEETLQLLEKWDERLSMLPAEPAFQHALSTSIEIEQLGIPEGTPAVEKEKRIARYRWEQEGRLIKDWPRIRERSIQQHNDWLLLKKRYR
jgi:hypothetical protein